MANPTLINGFEDVLTFISQQAERIKRLEKQEKKLREITCCAESEKLVDRVSEVVESKNKYFSEVENHEETIDKLQKEGDERDNEWRENFDYSWRNLEPEDGKQYYEELKEENEKLQKEIKEYEFESCESVVTTQKVYGQAFAIQAERDKLQKELEEKKFDCEFLAKQLKAKYEDSRKIEGDTRTLGEVLESEKKLKDQLNFIFPSTEEQNVIAKYQVDRTNRLREIKKLKEEVAELKEHLLCVKNRKDEEIQQYKDTLEEHFVHYDNLKQEKKQDEEKIATLEKFTEEMAEKFLKHYKETDTDMMFIGRKTGGLLVNMVDHLMEGYKKLENEAKAWNIINHGADWQNIRDLCDEDMREALIKTGECDKEDFE